MTDTLLTHMSSDLIWNKSSRFTIFKFLCGNGYMVWSVTKSYDQLNYAVALLKLGGSNNIKSFLIDGS